jgi:hypothetical protein
MRRWDDDPVPYDDPNTEASAGSRRPFPSLAVDRLKSTPHLGAVIAKAIYRTHFDDPTPSWDQSGPVVQRFFVEMARHALGTVKLAQGDPYRLANLVNEVALAIYGAHRRPETPIWDKTTPEARDWVTAQAVAVIAAISHERLLIRHRRTKGRDHRNGAPRLARLRAAGGIFSTQEDR